MSYITSTSIQWGYDPRITSAKLTEIHYLFFRIACHSIWPISHLHIIPIEKCAFLYALITDAPMSFPYLFICSLIEVPRSSSSHALFFLVFIHRILLHLGLEQFSTSKPIHIVAPIGATFLRQRAALMKASSKRPRVESFGVTPPPLSTTSDTSTKASVDPTAAAAVPSPSTSNDSSIQRMLETVITIQTTHG